jgi:hypothetical protein
LIFFVLELAGKLLADRMIATDIHLQNNAKASEFSVDQGYVFSLSCSIVPLGIPGKNS